MGWIDAIIEAVSPSAAYKRMVYKQALESMKAIPKYDAGSYEGSNSNWMVHNDSAEQTDKYSRENVRARARDLERNSDVMNAVLGSHLRNIIGGGYHVQSKTGDAEINDQLERLWRTWTKKQNCDVTGTQSLNQIIRMAVRRKKIDGGILFVKRYTKDGVVPFKLQMIEVDELDVNPVKPKYQDDKVVGGIEYNEYNKPIGYWIRRYDIDGNLTLDSTWIDAKDVIFYFTKRRPSQIREMSDMTQTIPRIRDVQEFMEAVSVKERIQACLSVFIKRVLPTQGVNPVGGRNPWGKETEKRESYQGKTLRPGLITELNAGDDITAVNPSGQGADATSFTKLQQRLIGAGQGVSYESSTRDMAEATYSSARQAMIEDGLTYKEDIELLIEVLDEIYETFVISAILCGAVKLSAEKFWANKDTYLEHEWVKEPKAWIDPQKEAQANAVALASGQKTYKQIAAEQGRDWRDQVDDMAEVMEYAKEKGVPIDVMLYGEKAEGESGADGEETEENG